MKLSNKTYDLLKFLVTVGLPAFTTFLAVVFQSLQLEYLTPVITILVAFTTFLGTLIGVSSFNYNNYVEDI